MRHVTLVIAADMFKVHFELSLTEVLDIIVKT